MWSHHLCCIGCVLSATWLAVANHHTASPLLPARSASPPAAAAVAAHSSSHCTPYLHAVLLAEADSKMTQELHFLEFELSHHQTAATLQGAAATRSPLWSLPLPLMLLVSLSISDPPARNTEADTNGKLETSASEAVVLVLGMKVLNEKQARAQSGLEVVSRPCPLSPESGNCAAAVYDNEQVSLLLASSCNFCQLLLTCMTTNVKFSCWAMIISCCCVRNRSDSTSFC